MQETQVPSLVQEDPTSREAAKPVHHNYGACALEPGKQDYSAHVPQLPRPTHPQNPRSAAREKFQLSATREKPAQQQRPRIGKNKSINKMTF